MNLKIRLTFLNFLEFAVWGAYLTSMGSYLAGVGLGPNIGWFYSVQGIVSIFMPALMGILADRWLEGQKVLSLCHALAGLFMIGASLYGYQAGDAPQFSILFSLYTLYRRHKTHSLVKKYNSLKASYDEMESSKTLHTQGLLEQHVARQIQEAMMPRAVPHEDIRLFATLKPADEIDCDLYDYFERNGHFYFCIGEAKGKGIDASTAMAITRTEFRTLSFDMTNPAEIVSAINKTLIGRNNPNMAVTLLVGVLDIATGRMCYSNAGQTAPMLVGSGIGLLPVDQNAAVGTHPDFHYTVQETRIDPGTLIFLYTQDLLQMKNAAGDDYGERRMLGESLQATKMLEKELSPETFANWMREAISRYTGQETKDDRFTIFTIQYKQHKPGDPYQRSIVITNDPKDEAWISYFTNEVCTAVGMNKGLSAPITADIVNVVKNLIKEVYPDGTKGDIHIEAHAEGTNLQFVIAAGEKTATLTKEIKQ